MERYNPDPKWDLHRALWTNDGEWSKHFSWFWKSYSNQPELNWRICEWSHSLISTGNEAEAIRLIESGVNVNLLDGDEQLPIHWASLRGILLAAVLWNPIYFNIKTQAWTLSGFEKVVQLLLERGDRNQLHIKDNRGDTALHKAAWQGNEKVVELLLNNGADIHSTNNKGQQPLDIAIQYGKNSKKSHLMDF